MVGWILLFCFVGAWVGFGYWARRVKQWSMIISVGGGFIVGCLAFIFFGLIAISTHTVTTTTNVAAEQVKHNDEPLELQIDFRKKIVGKNTIIYGETNLPEGTKLGISLERLDKLGPQDFEIYVRAGRFSSQPLTDHGKLLEHDYNAILFTYFNQIWQPSGTLREKLKRYRSPYFTDENPMGRKFEITRRLSDLN